MNEQNSQDLSPSTQLMKFIWPGALAAQAIYVAAKLDIADLVSDEPKTVDELAQITKSHAPSLLRLLRTLVSLGIFAEDEAGKFQNTNLGETLGSDHPESIRDWAIMLGAPFIWRPWGQLDQAVITGKPVFNRIYGESFFEYLASHPEDAGIFNAAMNSGSSSSLSEILEAYDFSQFRYIVDVGGGHGALLEGILSVHPQMKGLLYDLPEVVAGATILIDDAIADRYELRGGDFFEKVPKGADAYILKGIIHDWNDTDALTILRNCRSAIQPDGRLLLIEWVHEPSSGTDQDIFHDLMMLTLLGGRERTKSDFGELLKRADFSLEKVIPTSGSQSILECRPL